MSIQKIINRVPIMVNFEIGGILFRTQEKNLQRAPKSLLVGFLISDDTSVKNQNSSFFDAKLRKLNLLFRAIKICVPHFGMNAARSMQSTAIRTISRSDLRPADPDFRALYEVIIYNSHFQPIFMFYQEGVLERPSNIPLERFVEEIKFYGLKKQAIGDNKGIFYENRKGPLKFFKKQWLPKYIS